MSPSLGGELLRLFGSAWWHRISGAGAENRTPDQSASSGGQTTVNRSKQTSRSSWNSIPSPSHSRRQYRRWLSSQESRVRSYSPSSQANARPPCAPARPAARGCAAPRGRRRTRHRPPSGRRPSAAARLRRRTPRPGRPSPAWSHRSRRRAARRPVRGCHRSTPRALVLGRQVRVRGEVRRSHSPPATALGRSARSSARAYGPVRSAPRGRSRLHARAPAARPRWPRPATGTARGSFHGGMWVSTSRRTPPASTAACAARLPERWMPRRASRPSTKALSTRARSAPREQRGQRVAAVRVAGVGEDRAVGLDPEAVGLDRVVDPVRRDRERADRVTARRASSWTANSSVIPPRSRPWYISANRSLGPGRRVDRELTRDRSGGPVLAGDVEAAHVDAVVGVQVADEHGVELGEVEVAAAAGRARRCPGRARPTRCARRRSACTR